MTRLLILLMVVVAVVLTLNISSSSALSPVFQENMSQHRVYAYRSWQSVGTRVDPGDRVQIRADGEWLYTPGDYHGPEGHARYGAPSFYPLPNVPGGVLIGRIGEDGQPFYVGKRHSLTVSEAGTLYFQIDDDILSDNDGWLDVSVTVTSPTPNQ